MRGDIIQAWQRGEYYFRPRRITTKEIQYLCSSPTLTDISLRGCHLTNRGLDVLSRNTSLTQIDLARDRIVASEIKILLARNCTLRHIYLEGNLFGDQGADFLARNIMLTELVVPYNGISDQGYISLQKNMTLLYLNISGNPFTIMIGSEPWLQFNPRRTKDMYIKTECIKEGLHTMPMDIIRYIFLPYLRHPLIDI